MPEYLDGHLRLKGVESDSTQRKSVVLQVQYEFHDFREVDFLMSNRHNPKHEIYPNSRSECVSDLTRKRVMFRDNVVGV
ncbi:MAG: hypothetical protein L0Y56_07020, partial [Nitrospira sp.]|nr:hypothetical protein [Nitrospira sp.]